MSRLVVVTGPDGTGKTTLCEGLAARANGELGAGTASVARIWDSLAGLLAADQARDYLGRVGPRSRALLLLHGVARALDLAEAGGPRLLLFDGYWYKYAVSEIELGAPASLFEACARAFPRPDATVCVDLPVLLARARKSGVSAYEAGLVGEPRLRGPDGAASEFVAFQTRLRGRWLALEEAVGPWTHLDGARPPGELVDVVWALVGPLLAT